MSLSRRLLFSVAAMLLISGCSRGAVDPDALPFIEETIEQVFPEDIPYKVDQWTAGCDGFGAGERLAVVVSLGSYSPEVDTRAEKNAEQAAVVEKVYDYWKSREDVEVLFGETVIIEREPGEEEKIYRETSAYGVKYRGAIIGIHATESSYDGGRKLVFSARGPCSMLRDR